MAHTHTLYGAGCKNLFGKLGPFKCEAIKRGFQNNEHSIYIFTAKAVFLCSYVLKNCVGLLLPQFPLSRSFPIIFSANCFLFFPLSTTLLFTTTKLQEIFLERENSWEKRQKRFLTVKNPFSACLFAIYI